ncbi:hypothetical protein ElyMa_002477600 [Elysia marginata]|uniref:Uncharacterized protein n=1 Tax=Elysia marginata TaxID=1093978 RepID=A0AAV4GMB2_9GAST|nr:hypothetical protein ElyMa_002477600 [Elysia marginata]
MLIMVDDDDHDDDDDGDDDEEEDDGLAVKTLAQRSGGTGSISGRVKTRTLKLVLAADPPDLMLSLVGPVPG